MKAAALGLVGMWLAACNPGKAGDGPSSPQDGGRSGPTIEPVKDESSDKQVDNITTGSLAIDLRNAAAVGIAEVDAASSIKIETSSKTGQAGQILLTDQPRQLLARINTDGSMTAMELPDFGGKYFEIDDIISVGEHGLIVRFTGSGYMSERDDVAMIWIKSDGSVHPFVPDGFGKDPGGFFYARQQQLYDGKLWMQNVNQNALWAFDFASASFSRFTDENVQVLGFNMPSDGTVYANMRILTSSQSNPPAVLRRLKPNGGFDEFTTAMGGSEVDDSMVFGDQIVIYGQPVRINTAGELQLSFLPERLYSKASGRTDSANIVGEQWVASHLTESRYAYDLKNGSIAGNPFRNTSPMSPYGGTLAAAFRSNVDSALGVHFDGANLVKVEWNNSKLKSVKELNLNYPKGRALRVMRIFGADHGFVAGTFYGFGVDRSGGIWWVDIDATTGAVDVNGAKKITGISETPEAFVAQATVYQVGSRLVTIYAAADGNSLSWLEDDGQDGLSLTAKKAHADLGMYSGTGSILQSNHAFAGVNQNKLYIPTWGGIKIYDPSNNSLTTIADSSLFGATQLDENCQSPRHVAGIHRTVPGGAPAVVVRLCKDSDTANSKLAYVELSDWSFTALRSGSNAIDLGQDDVATSTQRRFPEPYRTTTGDLVFAVRWQSKVQLSDGSSLTATVQNSAVETTGLFKFGAAISSSSGIDKASAWSDSSFLIHGKNSVEEYVSYRVEPGNRMESAVQTLNGVQIYSATQLGTQFVVNGLRLSDNVRITATYDDLGEQVALDEESNIKLIKIVPIDSK
jgi:hypothetical protein